MSYRCFRVLLQTYKASIFIQVVLVILLLGNGVNSVAQQMSIRDTVKAYDRHRIITNVQGAEVRAGWGIANIAAGVAGGLTARQDQWKYFHETNAVAGLFNTGMALRGIATARRQAAAKPDMQTAYENYRRDKRAHLMNIGADVVCLSAGLLLASHGQKAANDGAIYTGLGRSLMIQGIFLLGYDNILLAAKQRYTLRWARILDELHFTGNGIGFNYPITPRRSPFPANGQY